MQSSLANSFITNELAILDPRSSIFNPLPSPPHNPLRLLYCQNPDLGSYLRALASGPAASLRTIMEENLRYNLSLSEIARLCHRTFSTFPQRYPGAVTNNTGTPPSSAFPLGGREGEGTAGAYGGVRAGAVSRASIISHIPPFDSLRASAIPASHIRQSFDPSWRVPAGLQRPYGAVHYGQLEMRKGK